MTRREVTQPVRPEALPPRRVCPICDALVVERACPHDGTATLSLDVPASDPARLQLGRVIGARYRIEVLIGTGGFAKVFRAAHTATGQSVALKVLDVTGFDDDENLLRRFFREARASASLRHPNTVRVFDFGQEEDGTVYLAMELLTGRTLTAEQARRAMTNGEIRQEEAIEIALAVAQSLSEAHALGLVHRDIGPNNIFLHEVAGADSVVKVLDFGLVKDGGRPLTKVHQLFGTAAFMSPEQVRGRPVDARSDLYSLGVTLWWMLAGAVPFTAETPKEVLKKHVTESIPPLSERARSPVSKAFAALVARATAKDPLDRFADAQELSRALEMCRAENRTVTTTMIEVEPPRRSRKKMVLIAAGAASLLALYAALPRAATPDPVPIPVTPPPPVVSAPEEIVEPVVEKAAEPQRNKPRQKKLVRKTKPKPPRPSILTTPI